MKITVRHNDTEIIIDEANVPSGSAGSIKWDNGGIQVLLIKAVEQVLKLTNPSN